MARLVRALASAPLLLVLVGCAPGGDGTPQASSVSQTDPAGTVPPAPTARVSPPTAPRPPVRRGRPRRCSSATPTSSAAPTPARRTPWARSRPAGSAGSTRSAAAAAPASCPATPTTASRRSSARSGHGALDVGPVDWLVIEGGGNDRYDDPAVTATRGQTLEAAAKRHPEARLVLVGTMDPTVDDFSDTDGVIGALAAAAQPGRGPVHQRAALARGPAGRWSGPTTTTRRRRATGSAGASWRRRCAPSASCTASRGRLRPRARGAARGPR